MAGQGPPFRPTVSNRPETGAPSARHRVWRTAASQAGVDMNSCTDPRRQYAALPYCIDEQGRLSTLLITSRGTGRWVLPKGWPDGAETGAEAAHRAGCCVVQVPDVAPSTGRWAHHLAEDLVSGARLAGLVV